MQRLKAHFENAQGCTQANRQIGIEIETLFVDRKGKPISRECSQDILASLVENHGWQIDQRTNGYITQISFEGFVLIYELGCNNFEIYTPTSHVDDSDLFVKLDTLMLTVRSVAKTFQTRPLEKGWDEYLDDNLMIPDKRDEIWVEVDGPALFGLGHIASIQFNIDLLSFKEGFKFIRHLNSLYQHMGWPHQANFKIWREYIKGSLANYEHDRYGPAPLSLYDYLKRLSEMKVVMQRNGSGLHICQPAKPFAETDVEDIEMFLRSVWWYTRLRVRNGKLVLEIRDIPRSGGLQFAWSIIREHLRI